MGRRIESRCALRSCQEGLFPNTMAGMTTVRLLLCLSVLTLFVHAAVAQAIPATPKKFTKRGLSSTTANGGSVGISTVTPPAPAKVRYVMHTTLCEPRQWQSNDGKSLLGQLIAFEDQFTEIEQGAPAPSFTPPANPTVVKDGKARLLVNQKPFELPLDRLSQKDRDFVEQIRVSAMGKTAQPGTPPTAPK